jgi:mono/diheme cytochrome c family protein
MRIIRWFGVSPATEVSNRSMTRLLFARLCLAAMIVTVGATLAVMPVAANMLTVEHDDHRIVLDRAALLARPDAQDIEVPGDVGYGGATRRYRAVPLSAILGVVPAPSSVRGTLEVVALDGYAAQIPLSVVLASEPGRARAWLAIEMPQAPWPSLPSKSVSAGPFYVVWQSPEASRITPSYWPYQVASMRLVAHPADRWPQIAVDQSLPAEHAARRGLEVYAAQCLACHRMNGAGSSEIGPDLNLPMNPTEYFQLAALRIYLRNPANVRTWPAQSMAGITADQMSDAQMEDLLAYLGHMVGQRK